MTLEDVELEAAPIEACMDDLDGLCPTDREIAEVEAEVQAPVVDTKPLSWSWSGVRVALIRGA